MSLLGLFEKIRYRYHGQSFIMPTFDPFRESWLECSNCRKLLFEKQSINEIPQKCPYCGVDLKFIIIDKTATEIRIDKGEIETIREKKEMERISRVKIYPKRNSANKDSMVSFFCFLAFLIYLLCNKNKRK